MSGWGGRVFGLGAIALGLVGLAFADFALVWQPVPASVPHRTELAYAVGAILVLAGLAMNWRRTAAIGAAILAAFYALGVILLHGPLIMAHPTALTSWSGAAEQLALVAGGLMAIASGAKQKGAEGLARLARLTFGVCLLVFGAVHFRYLGETAAMVPKWLPPGGRFWAWATGAGHIAAGLALLSGVLARLAAIGLTAMFAAFAVLVHAPLLFAHPASHLAWTMNAMNLALTGSAWVFADTLARRR